ncbi:sugar transferase [Oceanirhabdus seepicola]|uniref:Exopolysaccharide biosynthesis polyprenyl glycosylphosphotransferase n=1 Tax=Oceanirhabdus seepicola TaxID=2828781 RepID=A0A9J6P6N2_9CLOT|nr:exopolysaccharide biosynthesis polyprenyl glycosylphosphotransferase [Oceanirhabdus seepicola]MCM1992506.1 exopolysaccharide biosynthesis polyprenyl glycosylphosphotransferase [Oceanirhabdus seepicola]
MIKDNKVTYDFEKIDEYEDIKRKGFQFFLKRIMDITLSIIGIVILLPVFALISIAIKLDSKGPVIFKQSRVGKNNKNFKIFKFRTMRQNAHKEQKLEIENIHEFVFQSGEDPRITKVGKFLRKTSLDEIPQLFNVLIGNMSLVGPRPEITEVVEHYPQEYKQRLLVLPGITGLAQISGRGEIELGKTIYYDLKYIKNFSVFYDIKILFNTIFSVLRKEGAR